MAEETPQAGRWAIVVAFYAVVHDVNAYLWERLRIEPRSHEERSRFVGTVADLRPFFAVYQRLLELGFQARYVPTFMASSNLIESTVDRFLTAIDERVRQLLSAQSSC
jgi:hypothetical protein